MPALENFVLRDDLTFLEITLSMLPGERIWPTEKMIVTYTNFQSFSSCPAKAFGSDSALFTREENRQDGANAENEKKFGIWWRGAACNKKQRRVFRK